MSVAIPIVVAPYFKFFFKFIFKGPLQLQGHQGPGLAALAARQGMSGPLWQKKGLTIQFLLYDHKRLIT